MIERVGSRTGALFHEVLPSGAEDSTLVLSVPHAFHYKNLSSDEELAALLVQVAGNLLGRSVTVDLRLLEVAEPEGGRGRGGDPDLPFPPQPDPMPEPEPEASAPSEPVEEHAARPAPPEVDAAAAMHQATLLVESELNAQEVQPD